MASSTNSEKIEKERPITMYEGKNIHSSPVDGKLLCSFSEKTCMQRRLNHYAFCIRHVLEDKNSPFKQCKFVAKYNGQRCTNAIPLKEDRIYCNSHLQVLGLVPKKSRKKKSSEQNVNTTKHIAKSLNTEMLLPTHRPSQNVISKRSERATVPSETLKSSPEQRASRKAKLLSFNPSLSKLVSTYSQVERQNRNLLAFYGVGSSSDEDESDDDDDDVCIETKRKKLKASAVKSNAESSTSIKLEDDEDNSRSAKLQRLREKLRSELLVVNKTICSHNKDVKQSDQALQLLVTAVKNSPALTTAAIHHEKTFLSGSRKRSAPSRQDFIPCTAENTSDNVRCERRSIPYTKYCYLHIIKDQKQQLFHQCTADVSPTSKCSRTTLDLLYEKPLCSSHASSMDLAVHHVRQTLEPSIVSVQPVPAQKPPTKKPRKKPQVKATPTQKPAKSSRKSTKKESTKTSKSDKTKKGGVQAVYGKVKQEAVHNPSVNHINLDKCLYSSESMDRKQQQQPLVYPVNGALKLDDVPSNKNDMFHSDSFKEEEMFDENDMDVDDGLENDDLSEDLGDISPTGLLSESVLKLPPESPGPTVGSHAQSRASPVETFSMNSMSNENLRKPIVTSRIELPRNDTLCTNDISPTRSNHSSVISGLRPSRTTVIAVPKYPSSTSSPIAPPTNRQIPPGTNPDYTAFKPIGPPIIIKSEVGAKKPDTRPVDVNHGLQFFPLSFDPVLNSSVAWGTTAGKFVLNNRARPVLLSSQMNPGTFSPPSLSPHVSPQIALGSAFNFDRPSVLQHSNSPSPTLSPFSAHLPNSPHGKLLPRTLRLESRGNSNSGDSHDPFFGSTFDKP